MRLRGDEPSLGQDPPDRADRRAVTVPLLKMESDGRGTGFMPRLVEILADGDDLVLDRRVSPVRGVQRPSRPRFESGIAFGLITLHQRDHPPPRHPIVPGDLTLGSALDQYRHDNQPRHTHHSPLALRCERCPETGVNDVLNSDTPGGTNKSCSLL
jgi:hypothetical protein